MNDDEFAELAAGAALNALSPEDERAYLDALQAHPEWESIVYDAADTVLALADSVAEVAPPLALRGRLLAMTSATAQNPPFGHDIHSDRDSHLAPVTTADTHVAEDTSPGLVISAEPSTDTHSIQAVSRTRWTRGLFALAASLVLLIALGFGAAYIGQQLNTPASVVALNQIEDAPDAQTASIALEDGGQATVHWSPSVGKTVLISDELPELTADQQFELWYVRDGAAIPAGVFDAASSGGATALLDGVLEMGDTVAVTIEQQGGSPTGQPSGAPIIAIPTV